MGVFNFNEEEFEKIRAKAEEFYRTIESVRCPYFKDHVAFNAKGLRHLKFKSDQQARSQKDQYSRLKLLKFAPEVLRASHTVQGIWKTRRFEEIKTNSRWEHMAKDVVFYEFISVIDSVRLKVIVKEIVGGERYFWSVVPFWGIDKENSRRVLHNGDPDND